MNLVSLHDLHDGVPGQIGGHHEWVAMNDRVNRAIEIQTAQKSAPYITIGYGSYQHVGTRCDERDLQRGIIQAANGLL